jgi:acyl-CoA dehydrogenase
LARLPFPSRYGDNYVISGTKTWISNAGIADLYVTFCRFPQLGPKAYVALAVPAASARVTVEPLKIIAPHPLGTVRFRDCAVERSALIGREGDGLKIALSCLDVFRAAVGAAALGFAKRAFDEAVSFSRMRKVFGQSLSEFQITQAKFADMALAIDTSALLVYRAAWISDVLKQPVTREAAMAKLHATEAAQQVIDQAVQILGARGVLAGSITEQLYREIRALRIYEGTSEIQKLIIAGQVLKAAAGESNAS